jgi:hypothetical protein
MRLVVTFSAPYPSAGDVAEQLYATHVWVGTVFPNPPNSRWGIPPLYYFVFFIPLTYTLPFFTGARLLIAVMPALLLFPSYWFLRKAGATFPFAAFGGALVASATSFSAMVAWNAGYNVAGLFFALFFFAELVAYLRGPNRRDLVLTALLFAAVGATHFLTFLFVVVALLLSLGFTLVLVAERRKFLRPIGLVLLGCTLVSLPLVPLYYNLVPTITNVGPASGPLPSNLAQTLLPMIWGFASWVQTPLAVADVAVTVASFAFLLLLQLRTPVMGVLLGLFGGGLAIIAADTGNFTRGVYFLAFPVLLAVALFAETIYDRSPQLLTSLRSRLVHPTDREAEPSGRADDKRAAWSARRRWSSRARPIVAIALAAAFLVLNASYSYTTFAVASKFYLGLDSRDVGVLNWLADNTNASAKIFLGSAALNSWVSGYSNRMAFSPAQLNLAVTSSSYSEAYTSWQLAMGQYATGNAYVAAGVSLPAREGDPAIYLQTSFGWTTLENANSSGIVFHLREGSSDVTLSAWNATVMAANLSSPCAGCSGQSLLLTWPGTGISVTQVVNVSGESLSFGWSTKTGTLLSVSTQMVILPTNFDGLGYESVPQLDHASSVFDLFSLYGQPFTLNVSGTNGTFAQNTMSSGWTDVNYTGAPEFSWTMSGLTPLVGKGPFSISASTILQQFEISYIVADYNDSVPAFGFSLYLRCWAPNSFPGYTITGMYDNENLWVFSVSPDT